MGRTMADTFPFIWHELVTPDQTKSGAFFSELFGWQTRKVDAGKYGTYTLFQDNGKEVAGMMNPTENTPEKGAHWHSYIAVADISSLVGRVRELGGKVLVPPHEVAGVGVICVVADPLGAAVHLMEPEGE